MTSGLIIDLALGLFLVFSVLSLMVSGIQEWVAQLFQLRSSNLREGIDNLIGNDYAKALYGHGLIKGLYKPGSAPSYIPSKQFADALFDNLGLHDFDPKAGKGLQAYVEEKVSGNPDLRDALKALAAGADDELDALKQGVTQWFDDSMNRVSGWYARQAKWIGLAGAAVVVIVLNADTLRIVNELWQNAALREQLVATASAATDAGDAKAAVEGQMSNLLASVPLGWPCAKPDEPPVCFLSNGNFSLTTLPGWLLTIFAVSLGAPFWFDLLGRVARLRSSGEKPKPSGEADA